MVRCTGLLPGFDESFHGRWLHGKMGFAELLWGGGSTADLLFIVFGCEGSRKGGTFLSRSSNWSESLFEEEIAAFIHKVI